MLWRRAWHRNDHRAALNYRRLIISALTVSACCLSGCAAKKPISVVVERATTVASSPSIATPVPDSRELVGPGPVESNATIVAHVDGDTVRIALSDDSEETVRLIGIDTPETKRPNSPVDCFGPEASAFTEALLPVGTRVALELDVEERDQYGRLLAYVRRASDGLFVNEALAEQGFAQTSTYPPNVAYTDRFIAAVSLAREQGRGLWAACQ